MGAQEFEQFKKIRYEDRENLLKLLLIKEKWKENHNEEITLKNLCLKKSKMK